jgi:hypothetical protein
MAAIATRLTNWLAIKPTWEEKYVKENPGTSQSVRENLGWVGVKKRGESNVVVEEEYKKHGMTDVPIAVDLVAINWLLRAVQI